MSVHIVATLIFILFCSSQSAKQGRDESKSRRWMEYGNQWSQGAGDNDFETRNKKSMPTCSGRRVAWARDTRQCNKAWLCQPDEEENEYKYKTCPSGQIFPEGEQERFYCVDGDPSNCRLSNGNRVDSADVARPSKGPAKPSRLAKLPVKEANTKDVEEDPAPFKRRVKQSPVNDVDEAAPTRRKTKLMPVKASEDAGPPSEAQAKRKPKLTPVNLDTSAEDPPPKKQRLEPSINKKQAKPQTRKYGKQPDQNTEEPEMGKELPERGVKQRGKAMTQQPAETKSGRGRKTTKDFQDMPEPTKRSKQDDYQEDKRGKADRITKPGKKMKNHNLASKEEDEEAENPEPDIGEFKKTPKRKETSNRKNKQTNYQY